ncbi:MAG: ATP-dependent helicase [Terriglobales bacterium]
MAPSTEQFVPDPAQLQAIEHVHGPMLVVAGAGTGKTTVLVERIARLVREGLASPGQILAITFTQNAADELGRRVRQRLHGTDCSGLSTATFHSYCNGVLQRCEQSFGVLDKCDLWIYLRQRIENLPLRRYVEARNPGEFLNALREFFDRCHDELCDVESYSAYVGSLCSRGDSAPLPRVTSSKDVASTSQEEVIERCEEIAAVFRKTEQMLAADNLGTYGHMILRAWKILNEREDVLARERERARFVLIDEFQDCNIGQIKLARLLAGPEQNIFAVGDADQAIYRFRGASSAAFDVFLRFFPDAKAVVLQRNHRSTPAILQAAHCIISQNPEIERPEFARKPLVSARFEDAKKSRSPQSPNLPVEIVITNSDNGQLAEAADIAHCITQDHAHGAAWSKFAVLYRQHSHRNEIIGELQARTVPLRVIGADALETPEVRDLLACLRAVHSLKETESLFRVAALPVFGISPEAMRDALAAKRDSLISVLETVPGGSRVLAWVNQIGEQARQGMKALEVVDVVIARLAFNRDAAPVRAFRDFVAGWENKAFVKSRDLAELIAYMEYFGEAGGTIPLWKNNVEAGEDAVRLMTVHAAKGLEFDHVFLVRANSNSFPASYREPLFEFPAELREAVAAGDDRSIHNQEERRLFYVAMTRARNALSIYAKPGRGNKDPRPAGFLRELIKPPAKGETKQAPCWRQRDARHYVPSIQAAAAPSPLSGLSAWLMIPPRTRDLTLSATLVEIYEQCPLQYKLERDWNIPGRVAAQMQFGTAMHTTLKAYFDSVLAGRPHSEEQLLEIFRGALAEQPFEDPYQRALYTRNGSEQLRNFLAAHAAAPAPQVISTETSFRLSIAGVPVRGRIDRIDRIQGKRVAVIDYKTGSPWEQKDADDSLQLSIYAIATREKLGYEPERLVIYNLFDNTEVFTSRNAAKLGEAEERVRAAAESIEAGEFDPNPQHHCRWCEYRSLCPATERPMNH